MKTIPGTTPRFASAVLASAILLLGVEARAELIPIDLISAGDQLITRDTATGLDWLDLTATLNLSVRDLRDGAGSWLASGFHFASSEQVRTLFLNSDPGNVEINTGLNQTSPGNLVGAQRLLDLLGVTHPGPSSNDFDILGNGIVGVGEPGSGYAYFADYGTNWDATVGFFFVPDGVAPTTFKDAEVGSFLVRVSAVPEVSQAWLFVLGLAGVALGTREKRRTASRQR